MKIINKAISILKKANIGKIDFDTRCYITIDATCFISVNKTVTEEVIKELLKDFPIKSIQYTELKGTFISSSYTFIYF